jgi:hypothetical protein
MMCDGADGGSTASAFPVEQTASFNLYVPLQNFSWHPPSITLLCYFCKLKAHPDATNPHVLGYWYSVPPREKDRVYPLYLG